MIKHLLRAVAARRRTAIHLLILLLVPSLASLLYGWQFSTLPYQNVPLVIVTHDRSATAQELIRTLQNHPTFRVISVSGEDRDLSQALYRGEAAAGVLIPSDFSQNLLNGRQSTVMFFQDGALSPLVGQMRSTLTATLSTIRTGYLISVAEGKLGMSPAAARRAAMPLGYNIRTVGNPTGSIAWMTVQGLLMTILQVGVAIVGATICEATRWRRFVGKSISVALTGTLSGALCIFLQVRLFHVPYKGSVPAGLALLLLTCLGFSFLGLFLNRLADGGSIAAVSQCLILNMAFLLSGYTYPTDNMPLFFQKIAWFIPNYHFILPLRDMSLLGTAVPHGDLLWLAGFAGIMALMASLLFFCRLRHPRPDLQSIRIGEAP